MKKSLLYLPLVLALVAPAHAARYATAAEASQPGADTVVAKKGKKPAKKAKA